MARKQPTDLTGKRFGRLTVLCLSHITLQWKTRYWLVRCDCGTEKAIQHSNLLNPHQKSCGCYRAEQCSVAQAKRVEQQKNGARARFAELRASGLKHCSNSGCRQQNPQPLGCFTALKSRYGYDSRCKECRRGSQIMRKYGITAGEKARRVAAQGGVCGNLGCGRDITGPRKAHIDHDHETGELRGILCGPCNRALGMLGDSPGRIERLAAYVLRHWARRRLAA